MQGWLQSVDSACLLSLCHQAFSQYRSLNNKSRKSKRYGHLRRQPPLEPSSLAPVRLPQLREVQLSPSLRAELRFGCD